MLLIVPGLFLLTIWIAVIPAVVLENRGIGESFGRSRELVRGNGWNVFGVIILTFLLLIGRRARRRPRPLARSPTGSAA